ncbi:unnamed protein product [Closterium sp. Naga37s-1]|nr:unnamed protein product [Closterium sp. Naga37s-1]
MHIDGPLAQYLTPDGEADPGPLQPNDEVSPSPPMPGPMLADGPMEGLEETLRTEPREGAPILTPRPPAHPPPRAPHPNPHPQGLPLASWEAAKALAFLAEPCSPTPTLFHGQPPLLSPTPDPTLAGGPPGERAGQHTSAPTLRDSPEDHRLDPHLQPPLLARFPTSGPVGQPSPPTHSPPGLSPRRPPLPSQPGRDNENQGGRRRKNKGRGGRGSAHLLPPPSLPHQEPLLTPHPAEPAPDPTPTGRPPNLHSLPAPAPPQGHRSGPAHSTPGRLSLPLNPPQVAAAACAAGMEADGMRDAAMVDATNSPSHASHPNHVDGPLPQPMVIGEGQGGFLGQGASLPSPMETDLVPRPCHSHLDVGAPPPVQRVADTLPVAQEGTNFRDEASAPAETPPPGVAEPPLGTHPAEGQGHTTAHTSGSPPRPPSLASGPVPPRGPAPSCVAPPPTSPTPPLHGAGESSPPLIPGDPVGAQAAHGVPSTASSDATAPIDPTDTATSPDQVVRCPTCRSSLANRRALQHHTPFCHPADAARRAQAHPSRSHRGRGRISQMHSSRRWTPSTGRSISRQSAPTPALSDAFLLGSAEDILTSSARS